MRTLGSEVAGGRWGRSLFAGGLSGSFPAGGVAVLVCCTALSFGVMRPGPVRALAQAHAYLIIPSPSTHPIGERARPTGSRWSWVGRGNCGKSSDKTMFLIS